MIYNSFYFRGGCGGPERIDFYQFLLYVGVLVLIELIFKFLPWVGVVTLKE